MGEQQTFQERGVWQAVAAAKELLANIAELNGVAIIFDWKDTLNDNCIGSICANRNGNMLGQSVEPMALISMLSQCKELQDRLLIAMCSWTAAAVAQPKQGELYGADATIQAGEEAAEALKAEFASKRAEHDGTADDSSAG